MLKPISRDAGYDSGVAVEIGGSIDMFIDLCPEDIPFSRRRVYTGSEEWSFFSGICRRSVPFTA